MNTDERDYVRASQALSDFGAELREVLDRVASTMVPTLQDWADAEATTHEGQDCPLGLDHEERQDSPIVASLKQLCATLQQREAEEDTIAAGRPEYAAHNYHEAWLLIDEAIDKVEIAEWAIQQRGKA